MSTEFRYALYMKRGLHIVLEGPDASGKKTQSERLVERLIAADIDAIRVAFPQYDEPYGRLIREYLDGESLSHDPLYASILYAADRREKAPFIREQLQDGNWVICDRYVESNLAHQVARVHSAVERERLAKWINTTEYDVLGTPRADLTILLNVNYQICHEKARERRNAAVDIHEQDEEHLRLSWERYQQLAKEGAWPVVNCSPHGVLLSREAISDLIWDIVQNFAKKPQQPN